jgi:hypothetical protein
MKLDSKDNAVSIILNGALVIVAALSMLSNYYPFFESWIFLGACFLSVASLGVAAKVAFSDSSKQKDASPEPQLGAHTLSPDFPGGQADLISAIKSLERGDHNDVYWKIVQQIAERRRSSKFSHVAGGFSVTLNIINVYTSSKSLGSDKLPEDEKIDFMLVPELADKPTSEREIN